MKLLNNIPLLIIFLFALLIRFVDLSALPDSFHEDEVSNTYAGRFILQNGKDLYGNFFPLFYFDKFGDYPPVLPMYLSGIGTFTFGSNEFGARAPIALIGALSIFPLFSLLKKLFKDTRIAYVSTILLAVLPWHVVFSRSTAEGIVALPVYIYGLYYLIAWLESGIRRQFIISILLFLLTYLLYPSFRMLVPLTLIPFPFLVTNKRTRNYIFAGIFITALTTFIITQTAWGSARFNQTSLFSNQEKAQEIQSKLEVLSMDEGPDNITKARMYHNKPVAYIREFARQYLAYFSPSPLYLDGGQPYRYYPLSEQGYLYISFFPLTIIGLMYLTKNTKQRYAILMVWLLFIAPLPAAVTVDFVPHFHRAILLLLPMTILASIGIVQLMSIRWGKLSLSYAVYAVLLLEVIYFAHQYNEHSASFQPLYRNDGNRETVQYVLSHRQEYDQVIMPALEKLPIYYLYYKGDYSSSYIGKFANNMKTDRIDNVIFIDNWCPTKEIILSEYSGKTLIIDNGDCEMIAGVTEIKRLVRKNSTQAFRFVEITTDL